MCAGFVVPESKGNLLLFLQLQRFMYECFSELLFIYGMQYAVKAAATMCSLIFVQLSTASLAYCLYFQLDLQHGLVNDMDFIYFNLDVFTHFSAKRASWHHFIILLRNRS
jgi:hypothetical protein